MQKGMRNFLLHYLELEGVTIDRSFLSALCATYPREAEEAVRRYRNLALINGLDFADSQESASVEAFHQVLLSLPMETPAAFLPPWKKHLGSDWSREFFDAILA